MWPGGRPRFRVRRTRGRLSRAQRRASSRRGVLLAAIPHPSGRNRAWNDRTVWDAVRAALGELCARLIDPRHLREGAPELAAALRAQRKSGQWQELYLLALARSGDKVRSAEEAGVQWGRVRACRARDADFRHGEVLAMEQAIDRAEGEVYRRGVVGYPGRPVLYKGEVKADVTEYDGDLLKRS